MEEKRRRNWPWWLLAAGLAFVHFVIVVFVAFHFGPSMTWSSTRPRYQPGWFYYAFLNVFTFPWSVIYPLIPQGPRVPINPKVEVFRWGCITLTCFLWGMMWAEPFRWKYGWRPWRFTIRELLGVTAIAEGLLGWFAWISHRS
jgi:hypothetical protein